MSAAATPTDGRDRAATSSTTVFECYVRELNGVSLPRGIGRNRRPGGPFVVEFVDPELFTDNGLDDRGARTAGDLLSREEQCPWMA